MADRNARSRMIGEVFDRLCAWSKADGRPGDVEELRELSNRACVLVDNDILPVISRSLKEVGLQ